MKKTYFFLSLFILLPTVLLPTDLTIDISTIWYSGVYKYDNVMIEDGGVLISSGNVILECNNLIINSGGRISADGMGYGANEGPGKGIETSPESWLKCYGGGGYGGKGGLNDELHGLAYGSITEPEELGSGGSNGGSGGGKIKIKASKLLNNGIISANGAYGSYGGGGSGGSIYIIADEISGSGVIEANGGSGKESWTYWGSWSYRAGGGSGGRVAIYCSTFTYTGKITAYGGKGKENGGAGTIFLKSSQYQKGILIVDNNGFCGALTPFIDRTYEFDDVRLIGNAQVEISSIDVIVADVLSVSSSTLNNDGKLLVNKLEVVLSGTFINNGYIKTDEIILSSATFYHNGEIEYVGNILEITDGSVFYLNHILSVPNLTVKSGGLLTHSSFLDFEFIPDFNLVVNNSLIVESGGKISVDGLGYGPNSGPGGGGMNTGGGYGGNGGFGSESCGLAYGSITMPEEFGSGGGGYEAGSGGGRIKVKASKLLNNGIISANGEDCIKQHTGGGGGSGGSIYIFADEISGSGVIEANGGKGEIYDYWRFYWWYNWGIQSPETTSKAGGGGGGRIAIYCSTITYTGKITAYGGSGDEYGGAGTIFLKSSQHTKGSLIIDNGCFIEDSDFSVGLTPFSDGVYEFDDVRLSGNAQIKVSSGSGVAADMISVSSSTLNNDGKLLVNKLKMTPNGKLINNGYIKTSDLLFSAATFYHNGEIEYVGDILEITDGSVFYLNHILSVPNLTVKSGGLLTHSQKVPDFNLIVTHNLTVESGGGISVDGMGYGANEGPGRGRSEYPNYGGGGYGGKGGLNDELHGLVYGSADAPDDFGSGGGGEYGGSGGGKIKIMVLNLLNNGIISANGAYGSYGGGGSGGSIYIFADEISGSGVIEANGGSSQYGGGGGGRVAVYYKNSNFGGQILAYGGKGGNGDGENGSIIFQSYKSDLSKTFCRATYPKENLRIEKYKLEGKVEGDLTGKFSFDELEFAKIMTGMFANKSISKGKFTIEIDGTTYIGCWQGIAFLSNNNEVYLKGVVEGQINGTVEGVLLERVKGSREYNLYFATWTISEYIDNNIVSAKIFLSGEVILKEAKDYKSCELYLLQSSVEGISSGYYVGPLDCILTYIKINSEDNPYYNNGMALISYNSPSGSGNMYGYAEDNIYGYTGDIRITTKIKGFISSPIFGSFFATLNETSEPKKLYVVTARPDIGKPPTPQLKLKIIGPKTISPGQTITYVFEVRNEGLKSAEGAGVAVYIPIDSDFVSASDNYSLYEVPKWVNNEYKPLTMVLWNSTIPPKTIKQFNLQVKIHWGLPGGTEIECSASAFTKEQLEKFLSSYPFEKIK